MIALSFSLFAGLPAQAQAGTSFEVSLPDTAPAAPITGRAFVIISTTDKIDPRMQIISEEAPPFFGKDLSQLRPGESVKIDGATTGYPLASLKDLPVAAGSSSPN